MDQGNKKQNTLKVEKFPHNHQKPRAERWREWSQKLKFAFGAALPMLANQISEKCKPEEYWWGLQWNPQLFDFDIMTKAEEQQLYLKFFKAQYALRHV